MASAAEGEADWVRELDSGSEAGAEVSIGSEPRKLGQPTGKLVEVGTEGKDWYVSDVEDRDLSSKDWCSMGNLVRNEVSGDIQEAYTGQVKGEEVTAAKSCSKSGSQEEELGARDDKGRLVVSSPTRGDSVGVLKVDELVWLVVKDGALNAVASCASPSVHDNRMSRPLHEAGKNVKARIGLERNS